MALERNQEFLNAFGRRVRSLRRKKGFSMRGMADTLNVNVNHLALIEEAKINTSIMMAYRLAEVLGIPLPVLFDLDSETISVSKE